MGLVANLPVALAPGMGLNAVFRLYDLHPAHTWPWQIALGLLAIVVWRFSPSPSAGVRQTITEAVPKNAALRLAGRHRSVHRVIGLEQSGIIGRRSRNAGHPRQPALAATLTALGRD